MEHFQNIPTQTGTFDVYWKGTQRIRWSDHVANIEVLYRDGIKTQLFNKIQKHKLTSCGHIIRQEGMQLEVFEGMVEAERDRGRPRAHG